MRSLIVGLLLLTPAALMAQQQPTAAEAAFIYELNRARSNPQRYDTEQSLGGILNGVSAQPPLAVNQNLVQSAGFHAEEMATNGYFGHQSQVTGDWPNQMAVDAGYPLPSAWALNNNYIESLAANGSSAAGASYSPSAALRLLIEDVGVSPPGHRIHLLAMDAFNQAFREVGTGYAQGLHWSQSPPWSGAYWAVHTGRRNTDPVWLTGVVYNDANSNGRYDQGEGLSGVTIGATGPSTLNTTTLTGGAWTMGVTAGTWSLTCSGGSFIGTATKSVVVGTANREIDFVSGRTVGELDFEYQSVGGGPVLTIAAGSMFFNSPAPATPSAQQSYTVSGVRLIGNVTITAPSEFQVSVTSGSGFTGSVVLTPSSGTLASTTIYVRFNPTGASGASGNLTHAASGALDTPKNLTGTVSTNPAIFCNPTSLNLASARLGVASAEQSYSVSGYNLTANITVTAPSQFEVSVTSGSGFATGLVLTHAGGTVNPTTIYVRMIPTVLTPSGNITHVAGAASQNVAASGTVTNPPVISVAPTSLTLVAPTAGGPSAEQTFTVSGQYLGGDITVTAPASFEITLTSGSGYVTTFNLTPSAGVVASTTVFVRFLGGTAASGNVACASTLATTRNVAVSGTIAPPPNLTVTPLSLSMNSQGTGVPSGQRTFTVSGVNLVGNVTVTASTDFEVSLTSGAGFGASVNMAPTGGALATTTVFVRFTPSVGPNVGTATVDSPGATTRVVALTGTVGAGGGGSGSGGSDSGGGGCAANGSSAAWALLLLIVLAGVAATRSGRPACPSRAR
jgi:uncharacterized protein YkwD